MEPPEREQELSDLSRWIEACCTFREDFGTQLWTLHNSFIAWALHHEAPLLRRSTFGQLLRSEGFRIDGQVVNRLLLASALAPGLQPEGVEEMDELELPQRGEISATQWLRDFLSAGARSVIDIRSCSWLAHFSWPTILRAKYDVGARSVVAGIWELPEEEPAYAPATHSEFLALLTEEKP